MTKTYLLIRNGSTPDEREVGGLLAAILGAPERVVLGRPYDITKAFLAIAGGVSGPDDWSLFDLCAADVTAERFREHRDRARKDIATEGSYQVDIGLKMMTLLEVYMLAAELSASVELVAIFRPKEDLEATKA